MVEGALGRLARCAAQAVRSDIVQADERDHLAPIGLDPELERVDLGRDVCQAQGIGKMKGGGRSPFPPTS